LPWDAYVAAEFLRANARPKSTGQCGAYTRQAIEAGSVALVHHHSAKDNGPSLTAVGSLGLPRSPLGDYPLGGRYFLGDVAVIRAFKDHPHGHMQMYDATSWISDFVQRDFWPGPSYRRTQPAFQIYRYGRYAGPPPTAAPTYRRLPRSVYGPPSQPSEPLPTYGRSPGSIYGPR
jgi:hypothetical protein